MRRLLLVASLAVGVTGASAAQQADKNPYASPADVDLGGKLYRGRCGHCHGLEGEGGRGTVLNTGHFRRGGTDAELFQVIRRGVPNTEMPGAFNMPEHEVWRIVAFVQQLGRRGASEAPKGDAAAGAIVFQKAGCGTCHSVDGKGGFLGQDLTDVGAKRAVWHLRDSLVNPDADIALDYRPVTVTTKAGQGVSGIHLNEDEYSVHLRDVSGNLRSFLKAELKDVQLPRKSLMPSYASLPKNELEDLVAYLAALRPGAARPGVSELWNFDRLDAIGGHKTAVLGEPRLVDSPLGKALEFDGVDDALVLDVHPLAGARTFTLELVFRPDGGAVAQRFLHLNEDPATGADGENRMLLELRVVDGQWFLDSYHQSGAVNKALMNKQALHALGAWYHVATVYDGRELRNYVDGVQQGAFAIELLPQAAGKTAVGARINKVSHFKGAIRAARFTAKALAPGEFLDVKGRR
jgi:putative heme-binding domain-containing protein